MSVYILFHAHCPDGFGAAYAAWKRFGDQATYLPVRHGDSPPDMPPGSEVYIIDYAFKRPVLLELASQHTLKVLDHHRTAAEDLAGLDFAEFDMQRSGAVMSWQHFHPGTDVPALLQYVQDQDLWNWALPDSHAICAGLGMYPFDFALWDQLKIETLRQEGEVVLRYRQQLIDQLGRKIDWITICGQRVPAVNTPLLASELGNQLCLQFPEAAFSACYSEHEGKRKFSLRSVGESDVAKIAQHFGGGGHRNAAGFAIPSTGHPDIQYL
ncbi:MAG: DHHA1 domain-containing protein [Candidatus Sericytochromatia bacterium]